MRRLPSALILVVALAAQPAVAGKGPSSAKAPPTAKPQPATKAPPVEEDLPLDLPLDVPPQSATPARQTQPQSQPQPIPSGAPQFLLGVQVGPTFPGLFNRLGVSGIGNVQAAWQLPFMQRELGVFLQLGYTQPSSGGNRLDARLGGPQTWRLSVMDFSLAFGADYIMQLPAKFIGFGALGLSIHFSRSVMDQKAGDVNLGTVSEQSTRVGYVLRLGAGYPVGPGYLTLELENDYSGIDHLLTGVSNTGHVATAAGYLLRL